jgi:hypothetical protein
MNNANAQKEQALNQGQIPMLHPQMGIHEGIRGNLSPTSHIHQETDDRRAMMIQGSQPTVKPMMYLKIGNNRASQHNLYRGGNGQEIKRIEVQRNRDRNKTLNN